MHAMRTQEGERTALPDRRIDTCTHTLVHERTHARVLTLHGLTLRFGDVGALGSVWTFQQPAMETMRTQTTTSPRSACVGSTTRSACTAPQLMGCLGASPGRSSSCRAAITASFVVTRTTRRQSVMTTWYVPYGSTFMSKL